jgi:hypothetical protein
MRPVKLILRLLAGPGQLMHNHTRRLLLRGADGVVFVADSERPLEENEQALIALRTNLRDNGLAPDTLPMVMQLNKRDAAEQRTDSLLAQGAYVAIGRMSSWCLPSLALGSAWWRRCCGWLQWCGRRCCMSTRT